MGVRWVSDVTCHVTCLREVDHAGLGEEDDVGDEEEEHDAHEAGEEDELRARAISMGVTCGSHDSQ
eukprot:3839577-Prymnesium_polylepis.1